MSYSDPSVPPPIISSVPMTSPASNVGGFLPQGPAENKISQSQFEFDPPKVKAVKQGYWKTKMCHTWEVNGRCHFGDKCRFAHGQSELRSPGDSVAKVKVRNVRAIPAEYPGTRR